MGKMRLTSLNLNPLARLWFLTTACTNLALCWIVLKLINILPDAVISAERKKEISCLITCLFAKGIVYSNPHIRIKLLNNWDLQAHKSVVVLLNHTSPLDGILYYGLLPLNLASKMRFLFKADLLNNPIMGPICRAGGHFPVHFLVSDIGKFTVDKEKQEIVMRDIAEHLQNGGHLSFFPEGQLNRNDPRQLQTFRNGLFAVLAKAPQVNMYAFIHDGVEKSWHPEASLGGDPATIICKFVPILFSKRAQEMQTQVQTQLDSMNEAISKYRLHRARL